MTTLLAICRPASGPLALKRVQITQGLQDTIGGLFEQQALDFMDGIDEEVPFGGDWKPDADEILTLEAPAEIGQIQAALANPIALEVLPPDGFSSEHVKALLVGGRAGRIYIQAFTAQQFLTSSRLALMLDNNTFRQITEPAFTLDNKLVAIAEGGLLKFKSFSSVKRIFALDAVYRVASDGDIESLCAHASLHAPDVGTIKEAANQQIRRLIHAVASSNVLDQHAVTDIHTKAAAMGFEILLHEGRIVLPTERAKLKLVLKFLDDAIYQGPLSERTLITNSKRVLIATV